MSLMGFAWAPTKWTCVGAELLVYSSSLTCSNLIRDLDSGGPGFAVRGVLGESET